MLKIKFLIIVTPLMLLSVTSKAQGEPIVINMNKMVIRTANAPAPIGPYNQAILAGNTLYISGQIALDAQTGEMSNSSIEEETKKVMENIGVILTAAGMDYSNVVKCTIYLSDMNNFAKVNEMYGLYFANNAPARETVEVSRLPKDAAVEISCIAVK